MEHFTEDRRLLRDPKDLQNLEDFINEHHRHNCHTAGGRCLKEVLDRDGNVKKICRRTRNRVTNQHIYERITSNHSAETLKILREWGLTEESVERAVYVSGLDGRSPTADGSEYPLERPVVELEGGKHFAPSVRGDEDMSPFFPPLAALLKASINVQIVDFFFSGGYLDKYAAGAEENAKAILRVDKDSDKNVLTDVRVDGQSMQNLKISGVQIAASQKAGQPGAEDAETAPAHQRKKQARKTDSKDNKKKGRHRDERHREALKVCIAQMLWDLHDYPYVVSSVEFVHVNSCPPEQRCGFTPKNTSLSANAVQNAP